MEILQRLFRVLVLLSAIMNLTWVFSRKIFWPYYSDDMQKLLVADGYGSTVLWPEYIFVGILFVAFFCYLGLFFLKRWAIWLLIGLDLVVLVALAPFAGIEVSAPVERVAKTLFLMADGALISLAFFSDLKSKFVKH